MITFKKNICNQRFGTLINDEFEIGLIFFRWLNFVGDFDAMLVFLPVKLFDSTGVIFNLKNV